MAKIRYIKIDSFRCIKRFEWRPSPGVNCLIGPGDGGKSTVIDAIDLCLGARRAKEFADSDFHLMNTSDPVRIEITVSDLADTLKNFDKYDLFLRGFNLATKAIEDEPGAGLEAALTVVLTVGSDLDPVWSLHSDRAAEAGVEKTLTWGDRILLAGTRIGAASSYHLTWRKGSVLDRLSEEKPNTSAKIAEAKRAARDAFGGIADDQLGETLGKVEATADELGVALRSELQALLNAHSISLSGGTIAVHDADGVPLSGLGLGSTRLLVAGLLNQAQVGSDLVLVDELEHGLEPHRIIRFLGALGAKASDDHKQTFATSHSPIVLRELSAEQLFVLRKRDGEHVALPAAVDENSQGALRSQPEAFLAKSVLICEGASEIGLLRGLDIGRVEKGQRSIFAAGVSLLDAGGCKKLYERTPTLQSLGYRCGCFRDDDVQPGPAQEAFFEASGGRVFHWAPGQKLEAALICALPAEALLPLVEFAIELHDEEIIDEHLKGKSEGTLSLASFRAKPLEEEYSFQERDYLIAACSGKQNAWFKSIHAMEELTRRLIVPHWDECGDEFKTLINEITEWALNG